LPGLATLQVAISVPVSRFLVVRLRIVFNRLAALRGLIARFMAAARDGRSGSAGQPPAGSRFLLPPVMRCARSKFAGRRPRKLRPRFRARSFTRIKPPAS
jgi:hypothetical protein